MSPCAAAGAQTQSSGTQHGRIERHLPCMMLSGLPASPVCFLDLHAYGSVGTEGRTGDEGNVAKAADMR